MKNSTLHIIALFIFIPYTSIVSHMISNTTFLSPNSVQAVVLAAGGSTRFKSPGKSKLLFTICGREMISFPVDLLHSLGIYTTLVVGFKRDLVMQAVHNRYPNVSFVIQEKQLGTGHALLCTQSKWYADNILIMNGDMPLITPDIIERLVNKHLQVGAAISFVVSHNTDTSIEYGRLVEENNVVRIIEAKHFTATPEEYPLVNAGIYIVNRTFLEEYLNKIEQNELTHEFYLPDLVEIASKNDIPVAWTKEPFTALHGVNTLQQLAKAERIKQKEITSQFMADGVYFKNPKTVSIDLSVTIKPGTTIGTNVELRGDTHIGNNCAIESGTTVKDSTVKDNVTIQSNSFIQNAIIEADIPRYTNCEY